MTSLLMQLQGWVKAELNKDGKVMTLVMFVTSGLFVSASQGLDMSLGVHWIDYGYMSLGIHVTECIGLRA